MNHINPKKLKIEDTGTSHKPRHMHRRTISKTSEELLYSLKVLSPQANSQNNFITPQNLMDHLAKKGLIPLIEEKPDDSFDYFSDEELNIRNIIEQRKILSPICAIEVNDKITRVSSKIASTSKINSHLNVCKNHEPEKISFTTSTAFSATEESNIDRIIFILEQKCIIGQQHQNLRHNIAELMQKSPEPHYTLLLDDYHSLRGVYYIENATGYFHRILGNDNIPIVVAPRKIKAFLYYESMKGAFVQSSPPRFDAFIVK